jgi:hypothetical protein
MDDPALITRFEFLCSAAVACFSFSGALIMQMPREDRRTLFIFPIFLSVVIGGSLTVFGAENFGAWMMAGPVLVPVALVLAARQAVPGWLMTLASYVTLVAAVVCADRLLEASAFR